MSGDVQPRKRKEKRRKKEDEDTGTPPPTLVNPAEHATDNVTIHIYKEGSTGGHWCARIIFFALFTVLIGLVGVIIFEHRGTTDVDTPITSSKWAVIFEGWVDDVFPFHDEEEHEKHDSEVSHEVDHDEEEEHDEDDHEHEEEEEDDHEDEEEEDESGGTEGEDQEETEDNESNQLEGEEDDEEEGDEEDQSKAEDYDNNDAEGDEGISDEQNDIENEEQEEEEQEDEDEGTEGVDSKEENDEGFAEDDDMGVLDEIDDQQNDENEEQDDDDDDEEDITNISAPDLDMSIEGVKPFEKMDEDDVYEYVNIPGVNDIDDSTEPLEEIEEGEPEEIINEVEIEPLRDEVKEEEEETSVAVKFGVGVALVIAAHFVLVRRWKNVDDSPELIDLTRRNTIIPPPNPKQLNIKGDAAQKQQQVKHLQELESKYKSLPVEEIKIPHIKPSGAFQAYQNLSKKGKKDEPEFYTSESERFSGTEQESEYDDEDLEDEEDLEEEEEEIEDDEVEEIDDHELVAKLEAKYGKLPTPSQSEEEEEEEVEDEEEYEEEEELEEDEEEEKNIGDRKRLNAPQLMHSGVEKSKNKEVSKTPQSSSRGGRQEFDFTELIDNNDVNIQEEVEQWLAGDLDN